MSVALVSEVKRVVELGGQEFVDQVVATEKGLAPSCSGNLRQHISATQTSQFTWNISTHSVGENGVAYPARIEAGDDVNARPGSVLRFRVHGKEIRTKHVRASYQSHFAENTINMYR